MQSISLELLSHISAVCLPHCTHIPKTYTSTLRLSQIIIENVWQSIISLACHSIHIKCEHTKKKPSKNCSLIFHKCQFEDPEKKTMIMRYITLHVSNRNTPVKCQLTSLGALHTSYSVQCAWPGSADNANMWTWVCANGSHTRRQG